MTALVLALLLGIVAANLLDGADRRAGARVPAYALHIGLPAGRQGAAVMGSGSDVIRSATPLSGAMPGQSAAAA